MRRAISIMTLLVFLVAACGGSDDETSGFEPVLQAVDGMTGKERERVLLRRVEQEGSQLDWYTSMGPEQAQAVADAFGDAFDIDVAMYRASGETVVPRLLEEADADFHGADVVRVNGLGMVALGKEEVLVPYASPFRRELIDGTAYDEWTVDGFSTFVVSWNSKLVSESERPRSWEDLADPRWKGKLAVEAGDVDWYKALWEYWVEEEGKSAAEADRLFESIAANAAFVRSHIVLGQLVASGEFAIAPNYASRVQRLQDEGATVDWKPIVEPIFPEGQGIGLVAGARHPAAAVLFVDWLLSDGQKVLVELYGESARKDLTIARNAERRVIDFRSLAEEQEQWADGFERLIARGKEIEGR